MSKLIFSLFFFIFSSIFADNGYVIKEYLSDIKIDKNNVYTIKETLDVNFNEPRRGIYRIIPEEFNGRPINISKIKTNDKTHIKDEGRYKYIRLGNPQKYITGRKKYEISFIQDLGWDRNSKYDEVYFNIVGNDWDTYIENFKFSITLPKPFNPDKINFTSGEKGYRGDKAKIKYFLNGNTITGYSTKSLAPNESITIALPLEEGYFDYGKAKLFYYLIRSIFVGILGAILIALFCLYRNIKKNNSKIIETVEFYPPDNLTPTEIGYYIDGRVDAKDLTSMIFYWASKGYLEIEEFESGKIFKKKNLYLKKLKEIPTDKEFEQYLFDSLFSFESDGKVDISLLHNKFYKYMNKTIDIFEIELIKNEKSLYLPNKIAKKLRLAVPFIIFIAFGMVAFLKINNPFVAIGLFIFFISLTTSIEFIIKKSNKRTEYGNKILGRCLGFKRFLTVTEKEKLEMLLEKNPNYFYDILPYAIVLGVSDIWADKFKELVTTPPNWYHSNMVGDAFIYSSFISNMNHSVKSLNSSMLSSPKSTSNFGGGHSSSSGGSSGGGASGGGGGSW